MELRLCLVRSLVLGGRYGCVLPVVHLAGAVLARGVDCADPLSHRVAVASSIPNRRDSRERRSAAPERAILPSRPGSARAPHDLRKPF